MHGKTARPSTSDIFALAVARYVDRVAVSAVDAVAVAVGIGAVRPDAELYNARQPEHDADGIRIRTRSSLTPPSTLLTSVVPPENLVCAISSAGRDGKEIVTRSERTKAQNRKNRPGIQKWRALMTGEALLLQ